MQDLAFYYSSSPSIRGVPSRRANRIRFSWFVLGAVSGIAISMSLQSFISSKEEKIAEYQASALELLEENINTSFSRKESDENAVESYIASLQQAESAPVTETGTVDVQVKNGDTLISLLTAKGVAYDEAHTVVETLRKIYNPRSLSAGQNVALELDATAPAGENAKVKSLSIPISNVSTLEVTRAEDGGFSVDKKEVALTTKMARGGGIINSSLYQTGTNSGVPSQLLGEVIDAYSYDVDFQRDIQNGDAFDVVYEKRVTSDGIVADYGKVIYASLRLGGREMKIYRFTDSNGVTSYYNEKGESVKKALLKTPVNGARISSGFGMRHHPVLGYSKMHKGVDFAAPTGTPIYAAGDGTVAYASRKGAYGNYIAVKHTDKYTTAYAHLSRFAPGVVPGKKVKQGQVIGYVGSTGRSTGPHLHYEILVKGSQVNPNAVKFPFGNSLKGVELANFKRTLKQIDVELASLPRDNTLVADASANASTTRN